MNRGFSPDWQRFPIRGCQPWFHQNVPNMRNDSFWMDNNWNIPQIPPWLNQHHPGQERAFDGNFGNCIRGSYHQRPYRNFSYRGSTRNFSNRTGTLKQSSRSSCLINVTQPKKKSKKKKQQPEDSKEIKEDDKGTILTSEKEAVPSKVTLKDSQSAEGSSNQTAPVPSPGASAEEEMPPEAADVLPDTEKENIVLSQQDNLKVCEITEDLLNQLVLIPSPGVSTEEKTSSGSIEGLDNTEKEDSVLLEDTHSALQSIQTHLSMAVQIPFLSESTDDNQQERNDETEQTQTSAKQKEIDHEVFVPALDSSSHSQTLSDIRCVPVLVREKGIGLPFSWEAAALHNESQRGWAPEDYQEPPWSVNKDDKCNEDPEYSGGSSQHGSSRNLSHHVISNLIPNVSSCVPGSYRGPQVSLSMFPDEKHNPGRLVESKSCSPKSHYSSRSKDSCRNQTSRDFCCKSSRSPCRQECSSRSSHKREQSTKRREQSSTSTYSQERHSRSPQRQEKFPQKPKHTFKSPLRCKEEKSRRGCCCHFHCHCPHWSQESCQQRCSSPPYLTCRIKCLHLSKEISKVYRVPHDYSPEHPAKKLMEKRQSVQLKITEKKKKGKLKRRKKKSATSKETADSSCQPSAKEKISSSVPTRTPKDHTAAVLERKEEIEQAYLQVLLNFGVISLMLVEKEPCMIQATQSALRANLRKIGNYYECLLENYIDSLSEAA